jgi:CRP/FNR family cyclic AMP-dependent transcriptional regulator
MASPSSVQLARLPLFASLSGDDRDFIATNLDELSFPAGEKLITEGRGNHTFFVLLEGTVDVSVDGAPRPALGPGAFFGEISMDQQTPATATIVTRTPVRAYVMSRTQFRALKGNEAVLLRLRSAIVERLLQRP